MSLQRTNWRPLLSNNGRLCAYPDEVHYFLEERARLLKDWDGTLDNSRQGSNHDSQGKFQNGCTPQSSSADERVPTETVSNRAPTGADSFLKRTRDVVHSAY